MDLLSEIVRLNKNTSSALRKKYYGKLNSLNLREKCQKFEGDSFLSLTQNHEVLSVIKDFLASFLCHKDFNELSKALLFAYHFSVNAENYRNPIDQKMINTAKELVNELEDKSSDEKIIRLLDNYLAHFSIWNTRIEYERIEERFEALSSLFTAYYRTLQIPETHKKILNKITDLYSQLKSSHPLFVIEGLLQRYDKIISINELTSQLWDDIIAYYQTDRDHCFILLCIELRFHLLNYVTDPESRRDLFYNIDPESLLDIARSGAIKTENIHQIINHFKKIMSKEGYLVLDNDNLSSQPVSFFRYAFDSLDIKRS